MTKVPFNVRLIGAVLALTENTRVGNALQAFWVNRFEAAIPGTPDRSWIPAFVRDARYDANSWTRWELTRKIRYFEENTWLVKAIKDEFIKWTVGPNGMMVIPDSSDPKWNSNALEDYMAWCESPCLDSTLTMSQVHRLIASEYHIDGEVFILKTRVKSLGQQSKPAIQLVESHRCSSPGQEFNNNDSDGIIDGVQLGKDVGTGKFAVPVGYHVRDGTFDQEWVFRTTANMMHVFDPERIGMFRGITPYYSVLDTLHDLDDLEKMEMQRAKINSTIAYWHKTATGELPQTMTAQRRYLAATPLNPPKTSPDAALDQRLRMYEKVIGAKIMAGKIGEEMDQFASESPSAATQWYWRYKIGQVGKAVGVPLLLLFPDIIESMQGTVVRGVLDNAHLGFRAKFHLFAPAARDMYRFYVDWARFNRPKLQDAPHDWKKCHVIPPRAVNVDPGYNSQNMIAELAAGITNWDEIASQKGTTAENLIRLKAKNVQLINEVAKEYEIEPAEISANLADILQKVAQAKQADAEAEQAANQQNQPTQQMMVKKNNRKDREPVEA